MRFRHFVALPAWLLGVIFATSLISSTAMLYYGDVPFATWTGQVLLTHQLPQNWMLAGVGGIIVGRVTNRLSAEPAEIRLSPTRRVGYFGAAAFTNVTVIVALHHAAALAATALISFFPHADFVSAASVSAVGPWTQIPFWTFLLFAIMCAFAVFRAEQHAYYTVIGLMGLFAGVQYLSFVSGFNLFAPTYAEMTLLFGSLGSIGAYSAPPLQVIAGLLAAAAVAALAAVTAVTWDRRGLSLTFLDASNDQPAPQRH